MSDTMSLVLFSGTDDKLMAASIIASGGVANNMDVNIFVTFWGLTKTVKNNQAQPSLSPEGAQMKDQVFALLKKNNIPDWLTMLKNAKEVGTIHVYGCAMFGEMMGIKKEDLDPIVDDIIGVNEFVTMSKDSMTMFI